MLESPVRSELVVKLAPVFEIFRCSVAANRGSESGLPVGGSASRKCGTRETTIGACAWNRVCLPGLLYLPTNPSWDYPEFHFPPLEVKMDKGEFYAVTMKIDLGSLLGPR